MTDLTWEQREVAFGVMLGRAGSIWASEARHEGSVAPPTPAKELAELAKNVSGLCALWAEASLRAHHGDLSEAYTTRVIDSALNVAARCLSVLAALHVERPGEQVASTSTLPDAVGLLTTGEDLGLTAVDRIGRLLAYLGSVGEYYSDYIEHPESGASAVIIDIAALLAGKAICAALAAERGLWDAKEGE